MLAAVAGLHPALCQPRAGQRNRGPNFPNSSTTAQPRIAVVLLDRHHPHSVFVSCEHPAALRSSAAGSLPLRKSAVPRAGQLTSSAPAPRYGFAVVIPGRYSFTPLPGQAPPEVFRASGRQPFRLLAQTVSEQVRHRLRRRVSARQHPLPRTLFLCSSKWAVPSQAGEAVCQPHNAGLCRGLGASGLPDLAPPKPFTHIAPDRLPGHAPLRSASLVTGRL